MPSLGYFPAIDSLIRRFKPIIISKTTCYIDRLPSDILVDQIFSYLDVVEIVRLREVSKLYYHLTHHPAIWKRLLKTTDLPFNPLPPTSRYSQPNLTATEAERLFLKAYSLQKNWMADRPKTYDEYDIKMYHRVLSMVLLPGGHLVLSVSDVKRVNFAILVYCLEHPKVGAVPLARVPTDSKAYHLCAKYMTIKGIKGIVISYLRHDFRHRVDRDSGIRVSDYNIDYDIDPAVELKYECITLFLSLKSMEDLFDMEFPGSKEFIEHALSQPPAFHRLALVRSTSKLRYPSLQEIWGIPYLAVVKHPNRIIFKDLDDGVTIALTCQTMNTEPDQHYEIITMRVLPCQNQVLAVRKVTRRQEHEHTLIVEYYNIPSPQIGPPTVVERYATQSASFGQYKTTSVHITEPGFPSTQHDASINSSLPLATSHAPSLHIFICRSDPNRMDCLTIHPRLTDHAAPPPSSAPYNPLVRPPRYTHTYPFQIVAKCMRETPGYRYGVLPGAHRVLVYTVPEDDRREDPDMHELYRYSNPNFEHSTQYISLTPIQNYIKDLKGLRAMAWDETTGRLCQATAEFDKVVNVVDFAAAPYEDSDGRWPFPVELGPIEPRPKTLYSPDDSFVPYWHLKEKKRK